MNKLPKHVKKLSKKEVNDLLLDNPTLTVDFNYFINLMFYYTFELKGISYTIMCPANLTMIDKVHLRNKEFLSDLFQYNDASSIFMYF